MRGKRVVVARGRRVPAPWPVRERRLIRLGYRALALAYRKHALGPGWVSHFVGCSQRLFAAATELWRKHA